MATHPFLAMMSPEAAMTQRVGVAVVALVAAVFAYRATRRGKGGEARKASSRLALIGFVCGPVLGGVLACLHFAFNRVHPLDVGDDLSAFLAIGFVAGIIGAAAFGLPALLSRGQQASDKNPDVGDDLEW